MAEVTTGGKIEEFLATRAALHIAAVAALSLFLWIGANNSVTIAQLANTLATMPIWVLVFALSADYILDVGTAFKRFTGQRRKYRALYSIVGTVLVTLIIAWLLTGAITLSFAEMDPVALSVALLISVFIVLPKTGTTAFIAWIYIAALIVTGQYPQFGLEFLKGW